MPLSESVIAGGVSGIVTRLVVSPLDVLKIRFQLQLEDPSRHDAKYRGLRQAVHRIVQEEGFTGLWKGHLTGQVFYVMYGSLQFSTFEASKSLVCGLYGISTSQYPVSWNFGMGLVSGCVTTALCYPMDCVRTRLVGQGEPKIYRGITHAIKCMFQEGGVRTFYKGFLPTILQIGPLTGLQFGIYHSLKMATPSKYRNMSAVNLLCGAVAGVTSKTAVLPFDLVKKRLQVQGFEVARGKFGRVGSYRGTLHCASVVLVEEGVLAFYKGAIPSLAKASLSTSISFCTYEKVLQLLKT